MSSALEGKATTYEYDFMVRVTKTQEGVGDVTVAYNSDGQITTVTDGLNHTWTYAYDTALRLTSITDIYRTDARCYLAQFRRLN